MSDNTAFNARLSIGLSLLLALLLAAISLLVKPVDIIEWMGVQNTGDKLTGARIFLLLLLIDAVLIAAFVFWLNRAGTARHEQKLLPLLPYRVSSDEGWMNESVLRLYVIGLLALAVILRIPMLNSSLWVDEVLTLVNYVQLPFAEVLFSFKDDNQHLLFSLLARISVVAFGEEPWAFRLPALVFGVASIWFCFLLARHVFDDKVALLSMVFLSISFHHVWYSQNARGYTMLLAGTILSTWFLIRALQDGSRRNWIGFSLSLAFCSFAHLTGVIVGAGQALVVVFILIVYRAEVRYWYGAVASFFLAALLTLHGYALLIPQMYSFFVLDDPDAVKIDSVWKSPLWMLNEFLGQFGISMGAGLVLLVLGAGVAIFVIYRMSRLTFVYSLLSVVPAFFLVFVMLVLDRNLWPRLFFAFGGFAVIFLAFGVMFVGRALKRFWPAGPRIVILLPAVLVCAYLLDKLLYVYEYPKQDFTGARNYIKSVKADDDIVVGLHMAGKIYQLYYEPEWLRADTLSELAAHENGNAPVWVVYTLPSYIENGKPALHERLENDYELIKRFPGTLGDGSVTVKYLNPRESQ